ncbi:unnamed protein product [Dicrocoelium dendriticum]|nr:unnamed protein product [Dicrocoelium dendriticum]
MLFSRFIRQTIHGTLRSMIRNFKCKLILRLRSTASSLQYVTSLWYQWKATSLVRIHPSEEHPHHKFSGLPNFKTTKF